MQVIPVLDLKAGFVVRAIAGERASYRPIASALADSPRPLDVAGAMRRVFGLERLYVADLDAIAGSPPDLATYRALAGEGFALLVDAGVRGASEAEALDAVPGVEVVAALETLPSPRALEQVLAACGARRIVFSLDLKAGTPLGDGAAWPRTADEVFAAALACGVERLLLLDLAAVGVGGGPAHLETCRRWKKARPELELLTGGGVRGREDLASVAEAGVDGVLVASALHDGRLGAQDVRAAGAFRAVRAP